MKAWGPDHAPRGTLGAAGGHSIRALRRALGVVAVVAGGVGTITLPLERWQPIKYQGPRASLHLGSKPGRRHISQVEPLYT